MLRLLTNCLLQLPQFNQFRHICMFESTKSFNDRFLGLASASWSCHWACDVLQCYHLSNPMHRIDNSLCKHPWAANISVQASITLLSKMVYTKNFSHIAHAAGIASYPLCLYAYHTWQVCPHVLVLKILCSHFIPLLDQFEELFYQALPFHQIVS